jgi:hypothetical protein
VRLAAALEVPARLVASPEPDALAAEIRALAAHGQ